MCLSSLLLRNPSDAATAVGPQRAHPERDRGQQIRRRQLHLQRAALAHPALHPHERAALASAALAVGLIAVGLALAHGHRRHPSSAGVLPRHVARCAADVVGACCCGIDAREGNVRAKGSPRAQPVRSKLRARGRALVAAGRVEERGHPRVRTRHLDCVGMPATAPALVGTIPHGEDWPRD
eukprot:1024047-Prymnesium_polylepis.1